MPKASNTKNEIPGGRHSGDFRLEVKAMYTDYGYSVDGIEYATVDEAIEADKEPKPETAD